MRQVSRNTLMPSPWSCVKATRYSEVKKRMKRTLFQRVQIMERPAAKVMEYWSLECHSLCCMK
ncbi:hypothetical protein PDJAM_G00179940 [Pangasius djambal]|uniref:Uncharacterized protein n=1 Tax=Pangasius djambal TaxID=1691987 RepID=A0ACC5ZNK9_9TELE|nr:hypothetical protein [Pangasius djambal]